MKTFYWLVRREFWEHRKSFLWAPIITGAVVLILNILSLIAAQVDSNGHWGVNLIWQKFASASPSDLRQVASILDFSAMVPAVIISIVLFFVLFGYCMRNLSTDRRDRSILFWKSLPISDLSTVISKAFSAMFVASIIAAVVALISAYLMLVIIAIFAAFHGVSFGEILWGLPHLGDIAYAIGGLLPLYIVWMLPTVGWLMLCSAWSRGSVARWAIALPIAVGVIISWLGIMGPLSDAAHWFWANIAARILLGVLPGSWTFHQHGALPAFQVSSSHGGFHDIAGQLVTSQYPLLWSPEFLWGALAGLIMLALAIWLRRWRTEL